MTEFPRTLKHITLWLLLGTGVFLAVQAWQAQAQKSRFSSQGGVIELRRAADGHFHWPGRVNGVPVDFLVDTGATRTALPEALARAAGLVAEGRVQSATAGGVVTGWVGRADLQLQGGVDTDKDGFALLRDGRRSRCAGERGGKRKGRNKPCKFHATFLPV